MARKKVEVMEEPSHKKASSTSKLPVQTKATSTPAVEEVTPEVIDNKKELNSKEAQEQAVLIQDEISQESDALELQMYKVDNDIEHRKASIETAELEFNKEQADELFAQYITHIHPAYLRKMIDVDRNEFEDKHFFENEFYSQADVLTRLNNFYIYKIPNKNMDLKDDDFRSAISTLASRTNAILFGVCGENGTNSLIVGCQKGFVVNGSNEVRENKEETDFYKIEHNNNILKETMEQAFQDNGLEAELMNDFGQAYFHNDDDSNAKRHYYINNGLAEDDDTSESKSVFENYLNVNTKEGQNFIALTLLKYVPNAAKSNMKDFCDKISKPLSAETKFRQSFTQSIAQSIAKKHEKSVEQSYEKTVESTIPIVPICIGGGIGLAGGIAVSKVVKGIGTVLSKVVITKSAKGAIATATSAISPIIIVAGVVAGVLCLSPKVMALGGSSKSTSSTKASMKESISEVCSKALSIAMKKEKEYIDAKVTDMYNEVMKMRETLSANNVWQVYNIFSTNNEAVYASLKGKQHRLGTNEGFEEAFKDLESAKPLIAIPVDALGAGTYPNIYSNFYSNETLKNLISFKKK